MQKRNNTTTVRYPLATAGRRIIAKVLDIAIISVIVIVLGFSIFCTDPSFQWNQPLVLAQNWRYGLFVTLMAVVFFGLMLLLPRLWGKTIGMRAFKLFYFQRKECNYTFAIFKHELFIWEIIVIIAFAMGWTLSGLSQQQIDSLIQGANAIFASEVPEGLDMACYYVGTGFSCFYGVCIIFLVAIIVAICIRNGKPAFHDKYSNVYVVYKNAMASSYKEITRPQSKDEERDIEVPGVISSDSLEEIDNI